MGASQSVVANDAPIRQPNRDAADRILDYVRKNPGCYLREIKGELGLAMGTVQYQLERLEKAGKINSTRRGLYRHYFPVGILENEKDILQIFRQETARGILIFIIEEGNPTQSEISEKMNISSSSVNWQIKRLVDLNLINEEKQGKYKRYHLKGDSRVVVSLLKRYYPSLWDRWSDRLANLFLSMSKGQEEL